MFKIKFPLQTLKCNWKNDQSRVPIRQNLPPLAPFRIQSIEHTYTIENLKLIEKEKKQQHQQRVTEFLVACVK